MSNIFKEGLGELVSPITELMPGYKGESVVNDAELSDKSNPIIEKTTVTKGADGSEIKVTKKGPFDNSIVSDNLVPIADKKVVTNNPVYNEAAFNDDAPIEGFNTPNGTGVGEYLFGEGKNYAYDNKGNRIEYNIGEKPVFKQEEEKEVSTAAEEMRNKWIRAQSDPDGKMITMEMLKNPNIAKDIVANPVRMQKDYGADLAGDLFSIAVGALTGNLGSALAGIALQDEVNREQEKIANEQKADMIKNLMDNVQYMPLSAFKTSMAAIPNLNDADRQQLEAIYLSKSGAAQDKINRELAKDKYSKRQDVEKTALSYIKNQEGGADIAPQLQDLFAEIDNRIPGLEYTDNEVRGAILSAVNDTIKNHKAAEKDSSITKSSVLGNFYKRLLPASTGNLFTGNDSATANTSDIDHANFARMVYTLPKGERVKYVNEKKKQWQQVIKDNPQSPWKNNFPGFAYNLEVKQNQAQNSN